MRLNKPGFHIDSPVLVEKDDIPAVAKGTALQPGTEVEQAFGLTSLLSLPHSFG
jgi:hypothetical protein